MIRETQRTALALGLTLALAVALISKLYAADEKVTGDLKKLQGTWVRAGDDGPELKWVFEGETLRATVGDQEYKCKVALDSKATPHPTVDLTVQDGPGDSQGKVSKGIYKLEEKKLLLCVTHPGVETRPSEFKPLEGESYVFELKPEK
jgi:uncharacterized protein (TIGR03067 family)